MSLKYLFTALYSDLTQFSQTDADISSRDPKRSAYYDIDHDRLIAFALKLNTGDDPQKRYEEYTVDLRTGEFLLNGITLNNVLFNQDDQEYSFTAAPPGLKLRLIYFRKNSITFNTPNSITSKDTSYLLGWQATTPGGENVKRIIQIS